jgi:hypothetical protein
LLSSVKLLGFEPLLDRLASITATLLDPTDEFFHIPLSLGHVVIGDLAPLALDLSAELFELSFDFCS